MPSSTTLEQFISLVESGQYVPAIERFYAAESTKQEHPGVPALGGKRAHIARQRALLARTQSIVARCVRPVLHADDVVVIRWRFHYEWLDGTRSELEEVAWQRWSDETIVSETFFYDSVQHHHRSLSTSY